MDLGLSALLKSARLKRQKSNGNSSSSSSSSNNGCSCNESRKTFEGSNQDYEIETLSEFVLKIEGLESSGVKLKGWTFTQVDFSRQQQPPSADSETTTTPTTTNTTTSEGFITAEAWGKFDLTGAEFWGCTFPSYTNEEEVRSRGAMVMSNPPLDEKLCFSPFRAFMYSQEELQACDNAIYKSSLRSCTDLRVLMYQALHDHFVQDALLDYLENKSVVQ